MSDEILKVIERWQSDGRLASFDEARVKQAIILPILRGLGWDTDNPDEVWPEYSVKERWVDYALLTGTTAKVFIEAKKGGEPLERHDSQLLDYACKHDGVEIAALTNGATWWFYLPLRAGSWEQRKFSTVELNNQDKEDTTRNLLEFLSKENVRSGDAVRNAADLYEQNQKKRRIWATLPEAWNQLVSEPDDLLVELLAEKAKELCKHKPEEKEVEQFLSAHLQNIKITKSPSAVEPVPTPEPKPPDHRKRKAFTVTKPTAFTFNGHREEVSSWKEMLVKLCEILYVNHANRFEQQVLEIRGSQGRRFFSRNADDVSEGLEINGTGIYVDTHVSAESAKRFAEKVITEFGHDKSSLSFEARQ